MLRVSGRLTEAEARRRGSDIAAFGCYDKALKLLQIHESLAISTSIYASMFQESYFDATRVRQPSFRGEGRMFLPVDAARQQIGDIADIPVLTFGAADPIMGVAGQAAGRRRGQ